MKKRNRLFGFLNYDRFNKPDAIEENTKPTLKRYFKLLWRRLWKLISLNLMMLPMIFPVMIFIYLYISAEKMPTANNVVISSLYGAHLIQPSPATTTIMDLLGAQMGVPYLSTGIIIGMVSCIVFLFVTFGWQNAGISYCLRSMVRGEPVFIISDYFYAVKRNFKQGLFLGMIDFGAIFLLIVDILYFWNLTGFWNDVCFYAICALVILWFFMRTYIYLMLITFNLSTRKILKNALIFSTLGIKRNLLGAIGVVLLTAFQVALFVVFSTTPLGVAIPIVLPLIYYFAIASFTTAYAAYPIIDKYMIQPYKDKELNVVDVSPNSEETI